jgi:hypothetical protein
LPAEPGVAIGVGTDDTAAVATAAALEGADLVGIAEAAGGIGTGEALAEGMAIVVAAARARRTIAFGSGMEVGRVVAGAATTAVLTA